MENLNTGFYKDLDTNFEQAYEMAVQDFSHEKLLEMLKNGNIPEKQIAALKIKTINNSEEVAILLSNLTGCDGKIREATALKINNLLNENLNLRQLFSIQPERFAKASIDINGNICRLVIDSVKFLKNEEQFKQKYLAQILVFIKETFNELDNFIFRDKKYVINKQLFKLYWCLESLKLFADDVDFEELYFILKRASQESEYTIREKVAQILRNIESPEFKELKELLQKDVNYYVRQVF